MQNIIPASANESSHGVDEAVSVTILEVKGIV